MEARLIDLVGEPGKMLHTGRSRNDQVATDVRLWLRNELDKISVILNQIRNSLIDLAEKHYKTIMPGYTHLQVAQPITFGHHLLAYVNMFERDNDRLKDLRVRVNQLPLGSAALAGTSFKINRTLVAKKLDFQGSCNNSLDAVSDRDFAIEFCSCASILMMHISRLSEEMILWMSDGYKFIDLPDRYCTGSSIMPQKKNPDVPELARGKTGRVFGNLISLLTLMKSQPLAYNKDNQEDKEPLFDTVDTINTTLEIFVSLISDMKVNKDMMLKALDKGYPTATDLADYLVRKKIPFREAHEIVSSVVSYAIEKKLKLEKYSIKNFKKFSNVITNDVYKILSYDGSIKTRNHHGGTSYEEVLKSIKTYKKKLKKEMESVITK
jgi:argininosuccinate lyase